MHSSTTESTEEVWIWQQIYLLIRQDNNYSQLLSKKCRDNAYAGCFHVTKNKEKKQNRRTCSFLRKLKVSIPFNIILMILNSLMTSGPMSSTARLYSFINAKCFLGYTYIYIKLKKMYRTGTVFVMIMI